MKQTLSNIELDGLTIGFIYWLQEAHDMRGLKDMNIFDYPAKLAELQQVYNCKYPEGLTGWASEGPNVIRSMKTFNNLSFTPTSWMGPSPMYRAYLEFDNGRAISVITEGSFIEELDKDNWKFTDIDPLHGEYEVGFLQEGGDLGHLYLEEDGCGQLYVELQENRHGNDVVRHCTARQVTDIMEAIQKL